ncbi:hypothetical protein EYF80_037925 [Liparis tanakae]|uniref:Uncharacterized protein n=1 Tax=Liparis tanakae TaxID=230148 RepID=A0A4Z2GEU7_9TELE|nr:hypothetical protein EYF80_037925 [Liparis tanakae]
MGWEGPQQRVTAGARVNKRTPSGEEQQHGLHEVDAERLLCKAGRFVSMPCKRSVSCGKNSGYRDPELIFSLPGHQKCNRDAYLRCEQRRLTAASSHQRVTILETMNRALPAESLDTPSTSHML